MMVKLLGACLKISSIFHDVKGEIFTIIMKHKSIIYFPNVLLAVKLLNFTVNIVQVKRNNFFGFKVRLGVKVVLLFLIEINKGKFLTSD